MSYQDFLKETAFSNNVQGKDRDVAEKLLSSAIENLESAVKKQGYKLFDTNRLGAYGCDNMVFPQEVFLLERVDAIRAVGLVINTVKLAFAIYAEDGEYTLVAYCDDKASTTEQHYLDRIAYEIGKSIGASDVTGPSEHHYRISDVY